MDLETMFQGTACTLEQVLQSREAMLDDSALRADVRALYVQIMALSRGAQERWMKEAADHD